MYSMKKKTKKNYKRGILIGVKIHQAMYFRAINATAKLDKTNAYQRINVMEVCLG